MVSDPRWIYTKTGLDLNRAYPDATQIVGGYRARFPSLVQLPDQGSNFSQITPTIITSSSYVVLPTDEYLVIQRDNPVLTTIFMQSVASRNGKALAIVDWSTNVVEHTIRLTPAGGNTVGKQASWDMFSTAVALASATWFPTQDLLDWVTAP